MKIACVVGARPNFIKIAPLVAEIKRRNLDYLLVHTGQHYDSLMNSVFFEDLKIPLPDINLEVGSGTHAKQTGLAMTKLEEQFIKYEPDIVVVVGDVNSTLAGALAAAKLNIPVAHVEAGYRSFDRTMPEEINRVLVDRIAEILFAPTEDAVKNLVHEGIEKSKIHFVGNIMAETLLLNLKKIRARKKCREFNLAAKEYAVASVHRPENVDDKINLREVTVAFSKAPLPIIFPLHPRTTERIDRFALRGGLNGNLLLTSSLPYFDMLSLLMNAAAVITDSGGVQEEACVLGVPCITVRRNTERTITLSLGANRLVKAEERKILDALQKTINSDLKMWRRPPLWDASVSKRIVDCIQTSPLMAKRGRK